MDMSGPLWSGIRLCHTSLMQGDAYPIFPFYVVIDTSISMRRSLPAINEELPVLKREVEEDPVIGEIARFGVITFSDHAEMVLPLSDLADVPEMPTLVPSGATNYRDAFDLLVGAIPHDMDWFKQHGAQAYRPAVFFITDGQPSRPDWQAKHGELTSPSFAYRPNIVTFGFGSADDVVLAQVATFRAYAANEGEQPSAILRRVSKELTRSILNSSRNAAGGHATLALPETIPGMHSIEVDLVV